uniref:Uncharacterized protein n=1 Tax=Cucumis sativus TaxID=3659 RepID=A0A0A0KQM1_CUCSA
MLPVLLPFRIFLHKFLFFAFRLVQQYVFRFQKDDQRNEFLDKNRVLSKPSGFQEKGSSEMEMDCENSGKTRNSVLCSVSVETISSFTCGRENFEMCNADSAISRIQPTALAIVSKGRNSGGLKCSGEVLDVGSENNGSDVFDSLPEPEVQVFWEDCPVPSDSESVGDSTNGSPKINHDQVDDSSCKEINAEENKQLESLNNLTQKEEETVNFSKKSTKMNFLEKGFISKFDHMSELNYLPDHQDIVRQLEMELKNSRTGGLPTIFEEETESAETIYEKLKYEEVMGEIQKVYKTYAEKMWNLDVLNNQCMHAIGLLQLQYPLQPVSSQNSQNPSLWFGKARRLGADTRLEFIGDLLRDIELVYVGQVCLSWEILQWQLRKSIDLQRYDSQSIHRYNQVASEFQLFQVMLKRFMEEERFQGNRVENYVQNRCIFRSLLLVPPIKDDGFAEAEGREWEDEDGYSSNFVTETIEKSMCVFYEFLLSDKDDVKSILKLNRKHQIEFQNTDQLLLASIQAQFQKAERKLKNLMRCRHRCSAEKLRKLQEAGLRYSLILLILQKDPLGTLTSAFSLLTVYF